MVAHLMGDNTGLGKITRRAESGAQGVVEGQVDVHLLVARAVKRPHCRFTPAAGGGRGATKHHQLGFLAGVALGFELLTPQVLGVGQHGGHKGGLAISCGRASGRAAGVVCAPGAGPPPLPSNKPSTVSGLMPKIQPATSAMATEPRPIT